jgi:subtilisin-like proprotein convertase family protein
MTYRPRRGRNRLALLLATALLSIGAMAGTASAATQTFTNSTFINIPDASAGSPYPSSVSASGFAGNVQKVTATLNGFSHSCADDIAVLLVGPSGTNSVLMGHVGGCPGEPDPAPVNLTFDQSATNVLTDATPPAPSGTYRPSQLESEMDPLRPPAPQGPTYPANLGLFNGQPANGTWSLFVDDQVGGDDGQILGGWSLNLTAAVNTLTAGKPKLNKKKGTAQVPVTVGDAGQLTLRGKGVKSASASKSKAVAGPGTVKLTVKPKGKTAKKLNSTGKATVKAKITFTPNGGASKTVKKKIKLKKTL